MNRTSSSSFLNASKAIDAQKDPTPDTNSNSATISLTNTIKNAAANPNLSARSRRPSLQKLEPAQENSMATHFDINSYKLEDQTLAIQKEENQSAVPTTAVRPQGESEDAFERSVFPPLPNRPDAQPPTKNPTLVVQNRRGHKQKMLQRQNGKADVFETEKKKTAAEIHEVLFQFAVQDINEALQIQSKDTNRVRRVLNILYCAAEGRNVVEDPTCREITHAQSLINLPEDQRLMYLAALKHNLTEGVKIPFKQEVFRLIKEGDIPSLNLLLQKELGDGY